MTGMELLQESLRYSSVTTPQKLTLAGIVNTAAAKP